MNLPIDDTRSYGGKHVGLTWIVVDGVAIGAEVPSLIAKELKKSIFDCRATSLV